MSAAPESAAPESAAPESAAPEDEITADEAASRIRTMSPSERLHFAAACLDAGLVEIGWLVVDLTLVERWVESMGAEHP